MVCSGLFAIMYLCPSLKNKDKYVAVIESDLVDRYLIFSVNNDIYGAMTCVAARKGHGNLSNRKRTILNIFINHRVKLSEAEAFGVKYWTAVGTFFCQQMDASPHTS